MAWQEEITPMVRHLIDDFSNPFTYTDDRLHDIIITAAHIMNMELNFINTYTITISTCTISPDPSSDGSFLSLAALKAACIILSSESKTKAGESIKVIDGPATIDTGDRAKSAAEAATNACEMYTTARMNYMSGQSVAGQAIMTPRTVEYFNQ